MYTFIETSAKRVINSRVQACDKKHSEETRGMYADSAERWEDALINLANEEINRNEQALPPQSEERIDSYRVSDSDGLGHDSRSRRDFASVPH